MSQAEWLGRWHGTQSPVSAEIQPRIRYVRNEVVRAVTARCPRDRRHRRGGVAVRRGHHRSDAVLPGRRRSGDRLRRNIERMLDSVMGFIDMDRMRNVCMSEYLLSLCHRFALLSEARWAMQEGCG